MNITNSNPQNTNLLIIEKKNEVYITVECEPDIQREISEFFTFYVPGYKFMPAFRNRMWDGKIRLFSQKTKEIYFGLYPYIKAFAEERGYVIVCGKDVEVDNKVNKDTVKHFCNSLGQKYKEYLEGRDDDAYFVDVPDKASEPERFMKMRDRALEKNMEEDLLINIYKINY